MFFLISIMFKCMLLPWSLDTIIFLHPVNEYSLNSAQQRDKLLLFHMQFVYVRNSRFTRFPSTSFPFQTTYWKGHLFQKSVWYETYSTHKLWMENAVIYLYEALIWCVLMRWPISSSNVKDTTECVVTVLLQK